MALTALLALAGVTGCGGGDDNSADTGGLQDAGSVHAASVAAAWSPASLYASLAPGESTRFSVQFTASANANRLDVDVVREISPYVVVSPSSFTSVRAGTTYQLVVTLRSPSPMAVGVTEGVIQLREGRRTWSRPLKVDLTFSPIALPPDPGADGMATLGGIDADGDGIRDDVQRWIVLTHPESEVTREALKQRVLNLQEAVLSADDQALSIEIAQRAGRAVECLFYVRPEVATYLLTMSKAEVLNTPERSLAFIRHNEQVSGELFEQKHLSDWRSSCAFDPIGMER